jgi:Flp pilus assembly protein TadD
LVKLRDENLSDGVEYLQKAVTIDRGNAEWYFELGKAFMGVRQFAKAAKALKRAASLDMENKEYKELASEAEDKQRSHAGIYRKAK